MRFKKFWVGAFLIVLFISTYFIIKAVFPTNDVISVEKVAPGEGQYYFCPDGLTAVKNIKDCN